MSFFKAYPMHGTTLKQIQSGRTVPVSDFTLRANCLLQQKKTQKVQLIAN